MYLRKLNILAIESIPGIATVSRARLIKLPLCPTILFGLMISMLFAGCSGGKSRHQVTPGSEKNPVSHELSRLTKYLGKCPKSVGLWTLPEVEYHMTRLMGEEKYMEFIFLMQDAKPLRKERVIFSTGVLPDDAIHALGIIIFDIENNSVYAELIYPNTREMFSSREEPVFVPSEVVSRRTAFGVFPPEIITRYYPLLYTGYAPCDINDSSKYQLFLDPAMNRFVMHRRVTKELGQSIRKTSGYFRPYDETGDSGIITLIPAENGARHYKFRVENDNELILLDDESNKPLSRFTLKR